MDLAVGKVLEQLQKTNGLCPKLRVLDFSGSSLHCSADELIGMICSRIPEAQYNNNEDGKPDDEYYLESVDLQDCTGLDRYNRHRIIQFSEEQSSMSILIDNTNPESDASESDDYGDDDFEGEYYEDEDDGDDGFGISPWS
ncbi:hypothetical protein M422DRAFT_238577 [Sphaerobolus stellatus SS14]|nr:hypothetical protein M422DRAFT_238577 [Sphaerobolus stellatus SS14]